MKLSKKLKKLSKYPRKSKIFRNDSLNSEQTKIRKKSTQKESIELPFPNQKGDDDLKVNSDNDIAPHSASRKSSRVSRKNSAQQESQPSSFDENKDDNDISPQPLAATKYKPKVEYELPAPAVNENEVRIENDVWLNFGDIRFIFCHRECCRTRLGTKLNLIFLSCWHILNLAIAITAINHGEREDGDDIVKMTITPNATAVADLEEKIREAIHHKFYGNEGASVTINLTLACVYSISLLILLCGCSISYTTYSFLYYGVGLALFMDMFFYATDGTAAAMDKSHTAESETDIDEALSLSIRVSLGLIMAPTIFFIFIFYCIFLALTRRKHPELGFDSSPLPHPDV